MEPLFADFDFGRGFDSRRLHHTLAEVSLPERAQMPRAFSWTREIHGWDYAHCQKLYFGRCATTNVTGGAGE